MDDGPVRQADGLSLCAVEVSQHKLQLMTEYLLPGRTLDVGCGNGLYGLHAQTLGANVHQLDLVDRRDSRARHLPFTAMDAERLGQYAGKYETVLAFDVIEHLNDDAAFMQAVRQLCVGRVLLSVPNVDDEQLARIAVTHIHHKDKTHRREYTRGDVLALLKRAGFQSILVTPNVNTALPYFAYALATERLLARAAARLISAQCRALEWAGVFNNKTIGDWYCVAE